MLQKALYALLVVILVAIVCTLLGALLLVLKVEVATSIGNFLKQNSTLIGILGGIGYFLNGTFNRP